MSFKQELVEAIPVLRAYARSLSGNHDRADDLVQETLAKAIQNKDKYVEGTKLHAWLITILRNQYYSEGRKRQREVEDSDGVHAARLISIPQQTDRLELTRFLAALQLLPDDQREALILIGVSAFPYEDAAEILGTRVGTVKSRVSRARARLEEILAGGKSLSNESDLIARSAEEIEAALSV